MFKDLVFENTVFKDFRLEHQYPSGNPINHPIEIIARAQTL